MEKNIFLIEQLNTETGKWLFLMKMEVEEEARRNAELLNKILRKPIRLVKCTIEEIVVLEKSKD